jgi:hypothetical protein
MKINSDLTKTLLEIAAKTAVGAITNSPAQPSQNTPQPQDRAIRADADGAPEQTDRRDMAPHKNAPDSLPQETLALTLKDIGKQAAAAVTGGLSRQMDTKVAETVHLAELAIERQRLLALSQMQAVFDAERTKALEDLRKTAESLSYRIMASAVFLGGSLLMTAAALFLQR